jgi:transcriptional regulator with XRE-family HTH domain
VRGNHLVREMRKRAGLTQAELAERTGTTQSAIARLEAGHGRPTLERLSTIAKACGLDLQVRLVEADDHDWVLASRNLRRSPDQRIAAALSAMKMAEAFRRAGRAQEHDIRD